MTTLNDVGRRFSKEYARVVLLLATATFIAAVVELVVSIILAPPDQANIAPGVAVLAILEALIARALARGVYTVHVRGLWMVLSLGLATILLLASVGAATLVAFGIAEDI